MSTETETRKPDGDALTDYVHHHSYMEYRESVNRGSSAPTLCGFMKRKHPDAESRPCCPMCSSILIAHGHRCRAVSA